MKADVKAKTKTVKTVAATKAKAKPIVKSAVNAVEKVVAKVAPKHAVKTTSKAQIKPAVSAKPSTKPKAGGHSQTGVKSKALVQKPVAKSPVPKPASKTAAKTTGKSVSSPAPKVVSKASPKVAVKAPVKAPNSKVSVSVPVKAAPVKVLTPAASKPVTVSSTSSPQAKKAPVTKVVAKDIAKVVPKAVAVSPVPAKVVAAALAPVAPVVPPPIPSHGVVQKGGRPSARLVQITVPSMAQAVASTAAKASFIDVPAPLVTPPFTYTAKKDPKLVNNWKTKPGEALTDAELIAMPDSEYMNDKQMAAFRAKLSVLRQDILNSAGETTEHLREDTVVVPDPADRATIEEEHALELRTRDRERKLLKKIEQSINRIDAGDYGYCDETGEAIGVGRLLARPTANLSLEAQQRRELKQKMFGD